MTRRDFRAFAWALVAVCVVSCGAAWGVACGSLSVAREAVRRRP